MTRLALDTSAYSHFKRGQPAVVELLDTADWIGLSTIALGELRTGFGLGKRAERNERELRTFLANPVVHVQDIDDEVSTVYAEIVIALRAAGTPLPTNDIWIAAASARDGARVVTYDAHFRAIARVASAVLSA